MKSLRFLILFGVMIATTLTGLAEGRMVPDVPYLAAGRVERLDLYLPARAPATPPAPAAVWIHGLKGDKGERPRPPHL